MYKCETERLVFQTILNMATPNVSGDECLIVDGCFSGNVIRPHCGSCNQTVAIKNSYNQLLIRFKFCIVTLIPLIGLTTMT